MQRMKNHKEFFLVCKLVLISGRKRFKKNYKDPRASTNSGSKLASGNKSCYGSEIVGSGKIDK